MTTSGLEWLRQAALDMKSRLDRPSGRWVLLALIAAVFLLRPVYGSNHLPSMHILIYIMLFSMCSLGLNVVTGYCGLLNLGFFGFTAFGAFMTGILIKDAGWSFWTCIPVVALAGALFGTLLGWPTLRLTGDYFAIVTFGYAEIIHQAVHNLTHVTGGAFGMNDIPRPQFFGYTFSVDRLVGFYYTMFVLLVLTILACWRLQRSRIGRAWAAIREDETAAACCGINLAWTKTAAFAVSAGIGACAGCFYAVYRVNIDAKHFEFMESVLVLCYVVLGGLGSIRGSILGAAILVSLGEILRDLLKEFGIPGQARYLIFGLIMVLIMRFRPDGLLPHRHRKGRGDLPPQAPAAPRHAEDGGAP